MSILMRKVAVAAVVAVSSSAFGTVLGFDNLAGNSDDPFALNVEQGYTVSAAGGNWFVAKVYGNPVPDIYAGPVGSPSVSTVHVTGPGLFQFVSADFSTNNGPSGILYEGFLGGVLQYSNAFNANDIGFVFQTIGSGSGANIDELFITVRPNGPTSVNLDNIVVTPEPASMLALGGGMLALLKSRKRSKK